MVKPTTTSKPRFALALRKFLLSFFVVFTFIAYAIRNNMESTHANANTVSASSPLLAQRPDELVLNKATAVSTKPPPPTQPNGVIGTAPQSTASGIQLEVPANAPTDLPAAIPTEVPTDRPTDIPPTSVPPPTATPDGIYKDGVYDGPVVDAYYGNVQVEAIVQSGKIADVKFLDYPQDRRTSRYINSQAMPWLTEEAVQVQNANVDLISGATFTSQAFVRSLQSALDQAHL